MKKLTILLALLFLKETPVLSQILPSPLVVPGPINITSGPDYRAQNVVVVGSNGYNVSAVGTSIVEAVDYIQVLPGYEAKNLTGNGYAWLRINQNLPRIASFHPNGFSNIQKYERFEIGIALPEQIQNQINKFIENHSNGDGRINPYDPDQIKVECTFMSLAGNPIQQFTRHGFYRANDITENLPNDWTVSPGAPTYPFRIRFAPPIVGNWKGTVKIYLNNQSTPIYTANDFNFNVNPSNNLGHLKVSTDPNVQKLKYADGTIFYGIGRNVAFANSDDDYITGCDNYPIFEKKAKPIAHQEQRNAIIDLASNNCNFVRIRLDRSSVPIEETPICDILSNNGPSADDLTNFSANEKFMWEMDNTLGTCEATNMKILLTLLDNSDFSYYGGWIKNPYSVGGTSTRNDFFDYSNFPGVYNTFTKRLYYIEARWGYSTSIAAWEIFNETEGMGGNVLAPWDATTSDLVNKWLCNVKSYLQANTIYPQHLVTNGVTSGPPAVNWTQNAPLNFCLDFYTDHVYQSELVSDCTTPSNTRYNSIIKAAQDVSALYSDYWLQQIPGAGPHKKPHIFGEFGLILDQDAVLNVSPVINYGPILQRRSALTFHNQNWGSLFSNSMGIALQWWHWNINDPVINPGPPSINGDPKANPFHIQYKALSQFVARINFNTLLLPDRNIKHVDWRSVDYPVSENEDDATQVTTYWMRTVAKDLVYGWTKNTAATFMSDLYSSNVAMDSPICYTGNGDPNVPTVSISSLNNLTKVQGLLPNTIYDIDVYDAWDPSGVQFGPTLSRTTDSNGKLTFGLDMNTLPPQPGYTPANIYPDYAFIATKRIRRARTSNEDSTNTGYTPIDTTSNNPANTIIVFNDAGTIMGSNNTASNGLTTLNTKTSTSDTDIATNQNDRVYPVPASNLLYLVLGKNWQSPEVFIIDELSRESKKTLNSDRSIDVKDLPNGFYTLRVKDAKHEKMFKIVIEH